MLSCLHVAWCLLHVEVTCCNAACCMLPGAVYVQSVACCPFCVLHAAYLPVLHAACCILHALGCFRLHAAVGVSSPVKSPRLMLAWRTSRALRSLLSHCGVLHAACCMLRVACCVLHLSRCRRKAYVAWRTLDVACCVRLLHVASFKLHATT